MEITKEWLIDNYFEKHGDWYELNTLNLNVPMVDNQIYVSIKYKKMEISHSSVEDSITLCLPFTTEALSGFIALYGEPKRITFYNSQNGKTNQIENELGITLCKQE